MTALRFDALHPAARAGRGPAGYRLGHHPVVVLVTLLAFALAWAYCGPVQLGGTTSYAIANGVSMLPRFHAGDLVVLRRESTYHVGEVAAYHNGQLGIVVMHRIIAITDGHYEFKGDNNTFADSFEPTRAQIVGAEWIHLPGVGRYVLKLRNPAAAALLLGLLWLGAFWPAATTRRRRRRHRDAH